MSSLIVRWLLPDLEKALAERIAERVGPIHKELQAEHNRRADVQRHAENCRDILWAGMLGRRGVSSSVSVAAAGCSKDGQMLAQVAEQAEPHLVQHGVGAARDFGVSPGAEIDGRAPVESGDLASAGAVNAGNLGAEKADPLDSGGIGSRVGIDEQRLDLVEGGEFVPKNFTLHFSTPFRARVVQVVLVDAMRGGSGPDDPDDPTRGVCQYWSLDGQLLADTDDGGLGLAADGRGVEILRLRGLLKAMREELAALKAAKGAPC